MKIKKRLSFSNLRWRIVFFILVALWLIFMSIRAQEKEVLTEIKKYDEVNNKDLSKIDVSDLSLELLLTLDYNLETIWSDSARGMADKLLEDCLNPGLGVRDLHKQGLTGKGVAVAIIDQPLYTNHPEYNGKFLAYKDFGCNSETSMHGPMVASLLVGESCGTAPGAKLYYVAAPMWFGDAAIMAEALDWIIEENKLLPEGQKIRVVSVSAAPSGPRSKFKKNLKMWDEAYARAEKEGILVLDCTRHQGLTRPCLYDVEAPEDVTRCKPTAGRPDMDKAFSDLSEDRLYVVSSPRTNAEQWSKDKPGLIFSGTGGLSPTTPYAAGILALGWQVCPDLTHSQIVDFLFESAYKNKEGKKFINPKEFIRRVKEYRQKK